MIPKSLRKDLFQTHHEAFCRQRQLPAEVFPADVI